MSLDKIRSVSTPDYVIWRDGAWYKAKDGLHGQVRFQFTDLADTIQDAIIAIEAMGVAGGHLHVKALHADAWAGDKNIGHKITLEKAMRITGAGMNKTMLRLMDGVNDCMFELAPTEKTWITEFEYIKLLGNKAENPSGVGMVNVNADELRLNNMEFKDFGGYAYEQEEPGSYHTFRNCYFVNLHQMKFTKVFDLIIFGCHFTYGDFDFVAGEECSHVLFNGNRFWYGQGITIRDELKTWIAFRNNYVMQSYAEMITLADLGTLTDGHISINDNHFTGRSGQEPNYAFYIGDNWDYIMVKDNQIHGVDVGGVREGAQNTNGSVANNLVSGIV